MAKKTVKKEERKPFNITSLSLVGANSIKRLYVKMGYKHISVKYDTKKEVYVNTFN